MNNLQICPPHLSDDVATLPWEIPKSHFSTLLFIYFRLFTIAQKKTSSNCCSAALAVYLLLFNVSYYLHSPGTASGTVDTLQEERVYWYGHVEACGSSLLPHGLNFSTAWCTMRLISVEKDWKHVSMQKVVSLNTCCDVACLTFQLPHITTGSFQSHQCQPTACIFQSHQRLKECNKPSVRWKSFALHKWVLWDFHVGWVSSLQFVFLRDNVNNQKYVWIMPGPAAVDHCEPAHWPRYSWTCSTGPHLRLL